MASGSIVLTSNVTGSDKACYDRVAGPSANTARSLYISDNADVLKQAAEQKWEIVPVPKHADRRLLARLPKAMPFAVVPYDSEHAIVWCDANIGCDMKLFESSFPAHVDMVRVSHPSNHTVAEEAAAVRSLRLDLNSSIDRVMDAISHHGFHDEIGLTACGFSMRLHPARPHVMKMGGTWWRGMHICRRDQLSFDYSRWKHKVVSVGVPVYSQLRRRRHQIRTHASKNKGLPRDAYTIAVRWSLVGNVGNYEQLDDASLSTSGTVHEFMQPGWTVVVCGSVEHVHRVLKYRPDAFIILVVGTGCAPDALTSVANHNLCEGIITTTDSNYEVVKSVSHYIGELVRLPDRSSLDGIIRTFENKFELYPI